MVSNSPKVQEWTKRLERFSRSGLSLAQFCREEKIGVQSFYYWRRRLPSIAGKSKGGAASDLVAEKFASASEICFIIHAGCLKIEFHAESMQALDSVLSWASRHQSSSQFHQLVVRS